MDIVLGYGALVYEVLLANDGSIDLMIERKV